MTTAPIVLIAAVARNRVIGADNRMIWRLPTDQKRFRALTWGKPLVMGRKNHDAIGRLLPGRETVIVTRDRRFGSPGAHVVFSLEDALALADRIARQMGAGEIIVAGGGDIYAQTVGLAKKLWITEVDLAPPGDVFFPTIDPAVWREVRREPGRRSERDQSDFAFVDYERRDDIRN